MKFFVVKRSFVEAQRHDTQLVERFRKGQVFLAEDVYDLPAPNREGSNSIHDYYEEIDPHSLLGRRKTDRSY